MNGKRFFCVLSVCLLVSCLTYGSDWITLHEQSRNMSVRQAQENSRQDPASLDRLYQLGLVYLNVHDDAKAAAVFKTILDTDQSNYYALWGRAEILRRRHQTGESREILESLIPQHPDFSPPYITLAYILFNQGEFKEAVGLASRVIDQGQEQVDIDNFVRAYLILAGAKGMLAHYGGPIIKLTQGTKVYPTLKKAQKLLPDSAGVYFGLGAFYLLAPPLIGGDLEKAREYLEKAVALDPFLADAYVRLAQVYQLKGMPKKYEFYLNKALEIDPGNVLANDIRSRTCNFICFEEGKGK